MERLTDVFGENVAKLFDLMLKSEWPSLQLTYLQDTDDVEPGDLVPLVTFSIGVCQ